MRNVTTKSSYWSLFENRKCLHLLKIFLDFKGDECKKLYQFVDAYTQLAFTCPKLTMETIEQGVKYVQVNDK